MNDKRIQIGTVADIPNANASHHPMPTIRVPEWTREVPEEVTVASGFGNAS